MKVFVKKEKFGFTYKIEGNQGFRYFTGDINTRVQMIEYFEQGRHSSTKGKYNTPDIVFCNQQGTPAVHYKIVEGKTFVGQKYAIVDHDEQKKFLFESNEVVSNEDNLEFLRGHSTRQQDQEADKLETDLERIKYYLKNVAEETKVDYKQFLDEKMTADVLKDLCIKNAATYELPAEIIFE